MSTRFEDDSIWLRASDFGHKASGFGAEARGLKPEADDYTRATCSALGSAQQYQGSFKYGTLARLRIGRGEGRTRPAASRAASRTAPNVTPREVSTPVPTIPI